VIELREGEATPVDLSDNDIAHLETVAGGVFSATRRDTKTGRVQVTIRRHAGLWTLPSGRALCIHPRKGGAADLLGWLAAIDPFMHSVTWGQIVRWGGSEGAVASVLVRTFCGALLAQMAVAGPRREYRSVEGDLEFVRGAVRWSALAQQAAAVTIPCRYWERTPDTDLNRLFAAAIDAASGQPVLAAAGGHELVRLRRAFGMVPRSYSPSVADMTRPLSRVDASFEPVRSLAVALLAGLGRGHGGSERALAFSVNIERLFERTVEAALSTQTWDHPPRFQAQPPYLADGRAGDSRLDALVRLEGQAVVVDAKYAQAASKVHLYQVLAYMKMLGARLGVLVYPSGAQLEARRYRGQSGSDPWTVLAVEIDPVAIAHGGRAAVAACGVALRAFISAEVVESTRSTSANL
jgi:5-methylcytosine-specific restriction endonuclease McrBC regulatory subunit McrC